MLKEHDLHQAGLAHYPGVRWAAPSSTVYSINSSPSLQAIYIYISEPVQIQIYEGSEL